MWKRLPGRTFALGIRKVSPVIEKMVCQLTRLFLRARAREEKIVGRGVRTCSQNDHPYLNSPPLAGGVRGRGNQRCPLI